MNDTRLPLKAEDSSTPFSFFSKNGFYQVGDKIFNNKVPALVHASTNKQSISWNFNDDTYGNMDWKKSLGLSMNSLYKIRAQQLRDKYDYLILAWSGGADSSQALYSFLKNNIHLDEVVIIWPREQTKNKYLPSLNNSSTNMLSEWDFSIEPQLNNILKTHPNLKVTIVDALENLHIQEDFEDSVLISEKHSLTTIKRFRSLDNLIKNRVDKHQNLATVFGVSPISSVIIKNWLFVTFVDGATTGGPKSDCTSQGWWRNIEFFYWTPDFPEIPREQAHVLLSHINANPALIDNINKATILPDRTLNYVYTADGERYRRWYKSILYPDYDPLTFQTVKPVDSHSFNDNFLWFTSNPHAKEFLNPWKSAISAYQNLIDLKYCVTKYGRVVDYQPMFSKLYPVGKIISNLTESL